MTAPDRPLDSALIVRVPEAERAVGKWRDRHDPSATAGVPAHVTILFPFVPESQIDKKTTTVLLDLFAGFQPFDAEFGHLERRDDVIWLRPEPEEPFRALTAAVWGRWPEHPPYQGRFEDVIPHLTIAEGEIDAVPATLDAAVRAHLPIPTRVSAVDLITFEGRWTTVRQFPLG